MEQTECGRQDAHSSTSPPNSLPCCLELHSYSRVVDAARSFGVMTSGGKQT